MKLTFFLALFLLPLTAAFAATDSLLQTFKSELQREFSALQNSENPPYYLSLRVEDEQVCYATASFGALVSSNIRHSRTLTPQVRIGSYERDNTHELRGSHSSSSVNNEGGRAQNLPLENNDLALRQRIWLAVDAEYRAAQNRYEKVKANIATRAKEADSSPDFTTAKVEKYIEEKLQFDINKKLWENKVKHFSEIFTSNQDVIQGNVSFSYRVQRKYFISTEGKELVLNQPYAQISISALAKADNGTELPLHKTFFAFSPEKLPNDSIIINSILEVSNKLSQLKLAPEVEPYSGPAILSAAAAGVFFHEIFGHRIEGQRMRSESDGQTFKRMVGRKILPTYLSVSMNPTLYQFNNIDLNGAYKFDDEGVKSKNVEVVKNGVLKNFLMSRTPIEGFSQSNGHARAEAGKQPTSRQSNLIVKSDKELSEKGLRDLLKQEIQQQGKEFGYYIASVVGGFTTTGRYMPNSFNVTPTEVYRVYADGRPDELVRGVDLVGTPLAMFSQIECTGNDYAVFTGMCGAESGNVPVTAIAPSMLVRMIEVQKKPKSQATPPLLPKPTECK
ncbi:MAG: TldD/PmbA family protein [Prevotellaceae bacterium]|jgi:predicted Zn-dependent protease|nr:TldD/PmbA family protein [Prevotellaceae bacterium]